MATTTTTAAEENPGRIYIKDLPEDHSDYDAWRYTLCFFFFFPLTPFCRDRSQVKELFYWSASRHWDCFYTGQSPDVQSPRQSPLTNQGGCGGSRLGCVGSGGSCARRSLRDGGSPSRL